MRNDLDILQSNDIYSLALFTLYKLSDNSKYSTISEIPYIIDKDSLFRFLKFYGGHTIAVPTVEELVSTTRLLVAYQQLKVLGRSFKDSLKCAGIDYNIKDVPLIKKRLYEIETIILAYNRIHNDGTDDIK